MRKSISKYHPEYTGTEQQWAEELGGADGVGVKSAYVNSDGDLIIELTNDKTTNRGSVVWLYENLQYTAIKENNEITGYAVQGISSVSDTDIIIPSTYRGKPVKAIAAHAFENLTGLTSVTIPDSVTSIDNNAFYGCSNITKVTFGSSIKTIGAGAFQNCSNLSVYYTGTLIDWCDIERNGSLVIENFYVDNKLITHLVIPDSVKIIKAGSFANFRGLESITIPSGVMSIEAGAFSNCSSIAEINYNATDCKYIDKSFGGVGAANGVKIKIGANVKIIPENLFNCAFYMSFQPNITSVEFSVGSVCESIGANAFYGCDMLNKVYYGNTEEQWNGISIADGNSALTNSDNRYIYSETEPEEAGNYWHYVDGEAVEWELKDDGETVE